MSGEEDVVKAKENLQNALGERYFDYMQNIKKWFSGKLTKQEFDKEAREIVTDRYVHLHNEFLICILSKCNNFSSTATEAASTTIFPLMGTSKSASATTSSATTKGKRKSKAGETMNPKYNLRFVPVDPIKHAPSIVTASLESAALANKDFCLEFCARERTLPYAKMIHSRMLLAAVDYNLAQVDTKAVFLLAEATIIMLKNLIGKLAARSRFKNKMISQCMYEEYKRLNVTDANILKSHQRRLPHYTDNKHANFEMDPDALKKLKHELDPKSNYEMDFADDNNDHSRHQQYPVDEDTAEQMQEKDELKQFLNDFNYSSTVPAKKIPANLFDLKNLLQCHRNLMPSHSIYTINMEKIICNMWHDDDAESGENENEPSTTASNLETV